MGRKKDPNVLNKREKAIVNFIEKQINANVKNNYIFISYFNWIFHYNSAKRSFC